LALPLVFLTTGFFSTTGFGATGTFTLRSGFGSEALNHTAPHDGQNTFGSTGGV
jgi:hypothetical protein